MRKEEIGELKDIAALYASECGLLEMVVDVMLVASGINNNDEVGDLFLFTYPTPGKYATTNHQQKNQASHHQFLQKKKQLYQTFTSIMVDKLSKLSNSSETHYEILGVDETATALEIKGAHREKALLYHPDKCISSNETAAAFRKIQLAWECLRDEEKRSEYNDSLKRTRAKVRGAASNSKVVNISEMNCELCDVEDDNELELDEEDGGDGDQGGHTKEQRLYSFACRCGDIFEILEEELQQQQAHDEKNATDPDQLQLWDCRSCGLSIQIVNDIEP